jgi:hypothetical protein
MRIASRTARRFDTFDRRFDEKVAAILRSAGFDECQPYIFTRPDVEGDDVIHFDVEGKSFIVEMAYRPRYMDEIDELFVRSRPPMEPQVGAFSYLAPTCMTHRPKEYPCKLAARRDHSFDLVANGLRRHALAWLTSLRDPVTYADNVAPTAIMYVARANEVAGRLDLALAAYREAMRRELIIFRDASLREFVESDGAREFVYLCLKLGEERDKCEIVANAIKYRPKVAAFGTEG